MGTHTGSTPHCVGQAEVVDSISMGTHTGPHHTGLRQVEVG